MYSIKLYKPGENFDERSVMKVYSLCGQVTERNSTGLKLYGSRKEHFQVKRNADSVNCSGNNFG